MAREILIADSDKAGQEEFQKIFKPTDYHLTFSEGGEEALLRLRFFKPDIIIGERNLYEAIKADQELRHIPFILLLGIFEEVSDWDKKYFQADGIITKPLREDEILNLVDRLMEGLGARVKQEGVSKKDFEWKSFADTGKTIDKKKEKLFSDELGEVEDEEIIELVDVIEEPEQKMSIDDFITVGKEETLGETPSFESWEKQEEEKPSEEEFIISEEEEATPKEAPSDEDLFEKIELEEILQKVEQLRPSIEKEWPEEKKVEVLEEVTAQGAEPAEKYLGLEKFEADLKKEVKPKPKEEEFQPFFIEEKEEEVPEEVTLEEIPGEKELKELSEEKFPEGLLEGLGKELEELEAEEVSAVEELEEVGIEELGEEEIKKILEEEVIPSLKEAEEPVEEISAIKEPEEVEIEAPEEVEVSRIFEEAVSPPIISVEQPMEEVIPIEAAKEIEITRLEEVEAPRIPLEEVRPLLMRLDQKVEEIISKGVQEMMQDFMTKIIPKVTQNIISLTLDRIERMVKEIVPDLAEKAIQEEIKRLQKGEKD
jgi:CheY-like chemotaxis protein